MKRLHLPFVALIFALLAAGLASAAGQDDSRRIEGNRLLDLISDRTWYGYAVAGAYDWVEYYAVNGDAFYQDEQGLLLGTWSLKGEREVCFDYPTLGSFCFEAYETPSGQVAIYDLDDGSLIHLTKSIVEGDPENLASTPQLGDEVGN